MSMLGPLPDTPKTHFDAAVGHLESALSFTRSLGAHVWALLAKIDALESEVKARGETIASLKAQNERLREAIRGLESDLRTLR